MLGAGWASKTHNVSLASVVGATVHRPILLNMVVVVVLTLEFLADVARQFQH